VICFILLRANHMMHEIDQKIPTIDMQGQLSLPIMHGRVNPQYLFTVPCQI
jgi:hypothetical protein